VGPIAAVRPINLLVTRANVGRRGRRLTSDALVGDFEVRLEVLGARLDDGVHGGDEQGTVGPAATDGVHERRDVGATAQ